MFDDHNERRVKIKMKIIASAKRQKFQLKINISKPRTATGKRQRQWTNNGKMADFKKRRRRGRRLEGIRLGKYNKTNAILLFLRGFYVFKFIRTILMTITYGGKAGTKLTVFISCY